MKTINASAIFEEIKNRTDMGIGAEMLTYQACSKTGKQLIANDAVIQELLSYRDTSIISNILYRKLGEYGWGEWVICLHLELLLDYTIPMMSRVLSASVFVPGLYYKGEILWRILKHNSNIWNTHPTWKQYFVGLLQNVFFQYSEQALEEMLDERIYRALKPYCNNND